MAGFAVCFIMLSFEYKAALRVIVFNAIPVYRPTGWAVAGGTIDLKQISVRRL
jgi:hypothetical protein